MPWLTVIVPVHNGESFLRAALDSILLQGDPELEVIAVDDHSTDASAAILEEYEERLSLVRIRPPQPVGWVGATNLAVESARGRYACFLHQDDLWLPGRCDQVRRVLRTESDLGLVIHESIYLDARGMRIGGLGAPLKRAGRLARAELFEALLVQNFIAAPAATFSLDAARRAGPLDASLWYAADWAFWLALSRTAESYLLREPLAAFRIHPRSQTSTRSADVSDLSRQLRRVLASALNDPLPLKRPRLTPAAAQLSILVNGVLAAVWNRDGRAALRELATARPRHILGLPTFLRHSRILQRAAARLALVLRD